MFIPFYRPRFPDPNFFPSRIPDPGAKKAHDPGYRSRNTAKKAKIIKQEIKLFTVPTVSYNKYPYCMLSIERDNKLYKVYTGHCCVLKR